MTAKRKEIQVKVNLPRNLAPEDENIFLFLSTYAIKKPEVHNLRNVFVTRSGIVLKNFKIISASISSYPMQKLEYFFSGIYNFVFRKKIRLGAQQYLLIHNPWCPGYFAWVGQAMPRAFEVKDSVSDLILLLPERNKNLLESLKPFNFKDVQLIPTKTNFLIENLVLPSNPEIGGVFMPEIPSKIRELYKKHYEVKLPADLQNVERIYSSRVKAKYRKVENEEEVIRFLKSKGFRVIDFEEFSFQEQYSLMRNCKILVSIHGAGFANIQFMEPGSAMLEFVSDIAKSVSAFRPSFFRLSSLLGINYYYQFSETLGMKRPYSANLKVDLLKLKQNLELMLDDQ